MLRCLFKNTKSIEESLREKIRDLEGKVETFRAQYIKLMQENVHQSRSNLETIEWNIKFKEVMERLCSEKWELEMENEFLRKKLKERE